MESVNVEDSFNSLFQLRDEMMAGLQPFVQAAQGSSGSNITEYHSDSDSDLDRESDNESDAGSETSERSTSSCGSVFKL